MKNNLTEDQLSKLKAKAVELLSTDRHSLLTQFPFVGNILMRMNLIPTRDKRCRTACTDGKNIFFDLAFMDSLSKQERIFVLAHEIFHNVMLHLVRCQSRISELFNIATDMEVNYLLTQQKQCNFLYKSPDSLCFPPKNMEGKSAEVIYEWLLKNAKQSSANSKNGKNTKKSNSMSNSNEGGSKNGKNISESDSKNGKDTGKLEGQFDSHDWNNNNDFSSDSNSISDKWGEVEFDKDFKPTVSEDFAEKMREIVISEIQRSQRIQGSVPAGMDGLIKQLCKPEISWKEELAKFVTQCYNGKPRWTPPSRRHIYDELYLQSHRGEKLNVTVCIDTSGSCLGDLPKFFGELKGLLESFGKYDLHLLNCDADVDYYEHFNDENPIQLEIANNIKWHGGGGTSFKPPFKYVRKHNIKSDCFIYFTDGYGDAPINPPPYPVLWVLTTDGDKNFCGWGKKIMFNHSTENSYTSLSS